MSNLILNGVNVDENDIVKIHLDLKRNITVTLKDSKEIVIKKDPSWKDTYYQLSGEKIE